MNAMNEWLEPKIFGFSKNIDLQNNEIIFFEKKDKMMKAKRSSSSFTPAEMQEKKWTETGEARGMKFSSSRPTHNLSLQDGMDGA